MIPGIQLDLNDMAIARRRVCWIGPVICVRNCSFDRVCERQRSIPLSEKTFGLIKSF